MVFSVVRTAAVSGEQLGKHVPAATNTHTTIELLLEMGCYLCGQCRDIISKEQSQSADLYTGGCADTTRAREAEETPLLEAVARERLVKTQ
jgi:hypothetical protein